MTSVLKTGNIAARLWRARPLAMLVTLVVCGVLSGCGSSTPRLNTAAINRAIAGSILAQHHLHATVKCPSNTPRKTGLAFTCTASLNVGTYPIVVTETNGSGHVRYENQAPLLALNVGRVEQAIRHSIRSQRQLDSTVTCPAEVIQKTGITFTCTATVTGQNYPFAVTELDGDGHVQYVGLHQAG